MPVAAAHHVIVGLLTSASQMWCHILMSRKMTVVICEPCPRRRRYVPLLKLKSEAASALSTTSRESVLCTSSTVVSKFWWKLGGTENDSKRFVGRPVGVSQTPTLTTTPVLLKPIKNAGSRHPQLLITLGNSLNWPYYPYVARFTGSLIGYVGMVKLRWSITLAKKT
jgi:hypothetical protein